MRPRPVYLKLGGALLTRKAVSEAVRHDVLARLCGEIAAWRDRTGDTLVVAHGSGSFAHVAASRSGFIDRPGDRLALAEVAASARRLDGQVIEALLAAGVPALPIPGSLLAFCRDGRVIDVHATLVCATLDHGLVPVVYGDAAVDPSTGGAIASTEPLLLALSRHVPPARVVLATDVDGVYDKPPAQSGATPLPEITRAHADALGKSIGGAPTATGDVTGGMGSKVRLMLDLADRCPGVEIRVLSGLRPGAVAKALEGGENAGGTLIRAGD